MDSGDNAESCVVAVTGLDTRKAKTPDTARCRGPSIIWRNALKKIGLSQTPCRVDGRNQDQRPERFKLKSGMSPRIRTQLIRIYRREAVNPSAFAWYAKDTQKGATAQSQRMRLATGKGRVARELHGKTDFPAPSV